MTYLDLINQVLIRLREETIQAAQVDSNPYYRVLGALVNDAKDKVEDSWQWNALRDTDYIPLVPNDNGLYTLEDSASNNYVIKRIASYPNTSTVDFDSGSERLYLRWRNVSQMRQRYQHPDAVPQDRPTDFSIAGQDSNGNIQIQVFPKAPGMAPNVEYWLEVDHTKKQAPLSAATDVIKVPPLPVYSYATALASRERGEIGGTSTAEWFQIADRYLSDAIAYDSALYADEMDWGGNMDYPNRSNFRFA